MPIVVEPLDLRWWGIVGCSALRIAIRIPALVSKNGAEIPARDRIPEGRVVGPGAGQKVTVQLVASLAVRLVADVVDCVLRNGRVIAFLLRTWWGNSVLVRGMLAKHRALKERLDGQKVRDGFVRI